MRFWVRPPKGIIAVMKLKVHYAAEPKPEALHILESNLAASIHLSVGVDFPSRPKFQVLINGTPERYQMEASPELETLVIPYAGLPAGTRELLFEYPHIKVYNLHHNAAPTAELAFALLLSAAKFIVPFDRIFRQHDWTPRYQPNPSLLLEGKRVLILGFGHIGQRVGRYCQALGMEVLAIRRRPDLTLPPGEQAQVYPPDALDEVLLRSDIMIITLPLTSETDELIGAEQLSRMKPGGLLVNVGRGRIIDQGALYQALKDGTLGAAGLDVWYNYPQELEERQNTPPADFPFHELNNVVMSPHRGGASQETESLRMQHLAYLLNALIEDESAVNPVDVSAGY
jgi:phosphoglycerate dehydrogenase-like enzyme